MSSYTLEGIQPCQCTTLAGVAVLLSTAQCNVDHLSGPPKDSRMFRERNRIIYRNITEEKGLEITED